MKYNEWAEMIPEDRVEHFEDAEDPQREYHRLLKDAKTIAESTVVTETYQRAMRGPEPKSETSGRSLDSDEQREFLRELAEAPMGDATKAVLAKWGRLAPSE